jgi:hypothetical protein
MMWSRQNPGASLVQWVQRFAICASIAQKDMRRKMKDGMLRTASMAQVQNHGV